MKKILISSLALAALAAIHAVHADEDVVADERNGAIALFYIPDTELSITSPGNPDLKSDGGYGIGVRGHVMVAPKVFLSGEYQNDRFDGFNGAASTDTDAITTRVGVGVGSADGFYAVADFIRLNTTLLTGGTTVSSSSDGYGLHGGINVPLIGSLRLLGELGYINLSEGGKGLEYRAGLDYQFSDLFSVFADYRHTTLEADDNTEGTLSGVRTGLALHF